MSQFTTEQIAKRMQLLAYQASIPMGLGWLHEKEQASVAEIERQIVLTERGCYSDYILGRMVKCVIHFTDGKIDLEQSRDPRPDYQSWSGQYPTYQALYDAAVHSLVLDQQ